MLARVAIRALTAFFVAMVGACSTENGHSYYSALSWPGTIAGPIGSSYSLKAHDPHALVREARFDPDTFDIWSASRDIPAVVIGNPLAMDRKAFEGLVIERMQPHHWSVFAVKPRLAFVPAEEPVPDDMPRVVAAFDYAADLEPEDFCAAPVVATQAFDEDTIRMRFVLCRGKQVLASTRTSIWRGSNDADRRFRDRVSQLAFGLFPYRDLRSDVMVLPSDRIIFTFGAHHRYGHTGGRL